MCQLRPLPLLYCTARLFFSKRRWRGRSKMVAEPQLPKPDTPPSEHFKNAQSQSPIHYQWSRSRLYIRSTSQKKRLSLPLPPKSLNFGQSAFTWDSDTWQARQLHAVAVSSYFFLYAPIFLTYQLEDEPPAGCVFVKHFMTHGLFYNRINCTTIRILVCFFFFIARAVDCPLLRTITLVFSPN